MSDKYTLKAMNKSNTEKTKPAPSALPRRTGSHSHIKLLVDLPIGKNHGAVKGAVFEVTRRGEGRNRLIYFIGKAGQECAAYRHECEENVPHSETTAWL